MSLHSKNPKGSEWKKWDLQVQTIIDDNYKSIETYYRVLKKDYSGKWDELCTKIGSEDLVLKYDSKSYFFPDSTDDEKKRTKNYAHLFLNFIDIFHSDIGALCITDHNYDHPCLIDSLLEESKNTEIQIIPGVEINVGGVHILVLFGEIPYNKKSYSDGIITFLSKINIDSKKKSGKLTVCNKSYTDVFDIIRSINAEFIYPHCNSTKGLFQERGKTDRTYLASHFNYVDFNILQSQNNSSAKTTKNYINSNENLKSNFVFTLGSDARSLKDTLKADNLGNYCWIKAYPSFEGLKQIKCEPDIRVFIGENKPKQPVNTIDTINFNIPKNAKVGDDKFIFAGNNNKYFMSPYFNCFIGGRGTGKSTILNFLGIHSNNPISSQFFWFGDKKDKIGIKPKGFSPEDKTFFSYTGTETFEYLGQSEIEAFATDKVKFTQAIYDRANGPNKLLHEYETDILNLKKKLKSIVDAISDLTNLEKQKEAKEREKKTLEKSIEIISSKHYSLVIATISKKSKELLNINNWKQKIINLRESLEYLIPEDDTLDNPNKKNLSIEEKSKYEQIYKLTISKINGLIEMLKDNNFTDEIENEKEKKEALKLLENKVKLILEKADLSAENVEQIKSAPYKITNLEGDIKEISSEIESKKKLIDDFGKIVSKLKKDKINFEKKITEILNPLQKLLKTQFKENQGKDIKQISLQYSFDLQTAWESLTLDFYQHFRIKYSNNESGADVCNFIINNNKTFSENSLKAIQKCISDNMTDRKYMLFIEGVFNNPLNFKIFQMIRDKHLFDVTSYKIIQVKYDGSPVENASFGQRCTAVIVILLLFGNYPLIIDEPETHLDSSLIANYLVPLLKEKKADRQIIFATHNANFVINGDAEKIFILKNEKQVTEIIETTIEDVANRDSLLKLEGGKEAFEKRGEKLSIIK